MAASDSPFGFSDFQTSGRLSWVLLPSQPPTGKPFDKDMPICHYLGVSDLFPLAPLLHYDILVVETELERSNYDGETAGLQM
jgi:hypothetical protein